MSFGKVVIMGKLQSSLLVLLGLLCLTWGWEPNTEYVYKYVGRSVAGIYKLKQQNAVIEVRTSVTVQSIDDSTLLVKLADSRIKRNGNYLAAPYIGFNESPEEIEGVEDAIPDSEHLAAPFSVAHAKGSITSVHTGANEPLWVVNIKKSIASQLQLDVTGAKDGEGSTFSVYEDTVTGNCKTDVAISPLAPQAACKGKAAYQIIKTKDFNNCKSSPVWHTTTSNVYTCDFDKANCGDFIKRTSVSKYIACGDSLSNLLIVQVNAGSDLIAQPFAYKTDELVNSIVIQMSLEKTEAISSLLASPAAPKAHTSLSYVFSGTNTQPSLFAALNTPIAPIATLHQNVLSGIRAVTTDLKETSDAEKDNIERMAAVVHTLSMFSMDELRSLWQDVKGEDCVYVTLFIDSVVQTGSNPAVLLIKELIETEQITGHKANFALSPLGYYAKTPTRELLRELVSLVKSAPVQSSKVLKQISMTTVADLMNVACGPSAAKRFASPADFCTSKDAIIINEFLPLLAKELEASKEVYDRIVALAAIGSLGVEEIVPVLLPVIRGNGKFDDTAERVRAILSLGRVVFTAPEKVHPILAALATNFGERNEVRMAAIGLLLTSNAPLSMWQKIATSTWFEPSKQMISFVSRLITSLAKVPAATPLTAELAQKASVNLLNVKPSPFGLPYSFYDIQSSNLEEGIAVMMPTIWMRDTDQKIPVYSSNSYFYALGPLNREPFTISMYNFNMADFWQNLFTKMYMGLSVKYDALWAEKKGGKKGDAIKGIWEQLNASAKPADKRAGLLHINLLSSIDRFVNLESLEEEIPKFMADLVKYQKVPYEISLTKYRMLGEYNVRFASELGLPMRYLFTLPLITSTHGTLQGDSNRNIKSEISCELSWKITGEIRVDIPFSGNYIATGVDVLVDSHAPKNFNFYSKDGLFKIDSTPDDRIVDLLYFHVKPYTTTRNMADSINPTLEDSATHIISVTDKPIKREFPIGQIIGLNVNLIEESESPNSDKQSWGEWFAKWDINSWSNLGCFLPLELHHRKYMIRYNPVGSQAKAIRTSYFYQYATKSSNTNLVYESGSAKSRTPTEPEIYGYSPIAPVLQPLANRMFAGIDSGNARVMEASLTSELADGTLINVKSMVGLSMNIRYTKDYHDWQVEYSTTKPGGEKKMNFAICYWAVRDWNNPPMYGFSKDLLYMNEEDTIGFGPACEHKVKYTAKLYRDESAAQVAINSKPGQQCLKDMESGFKYGSPACTEARILDHTYNYYEQTSQASNMVPEWLQWARRHATWMNLNIEPYIVEHKHAQSNYPFRASWTTIRDPITGNSDMTFVRPHETVVAKNVRWPDTIRKFSPLTDAFAKVFYPLTAGSNHISDALNILSAGVSEAKCYVGEDAVYTFDGAHYKYTLNECPHVLMTDCHRKSEIAVLASRGKDGQKLVTLIYGPDTIELDPNGFAVVNGEKTAFDSIQKGSYIEIRTPGSKSLKVAIFPMAEGGVIVDVRPTQFWFKVQGNHVQLYAPVHIRGRACGLCGDFNQEDKDEFKTADRCVVSSGELMAASFMLKSGDGCAAPSSLKDETATCQSIDKFFSTNLPDYKVGSKCGDSLVSKSAANTCSSP